MSAPETSCVYAPGMINRPLRQDISTTSTVPIEYINDSGAGRTILPQRPVCNQGVPKSLISKAIGKASSPINFDTGGGSRQSDQSLGLLSRTLGKSEAYVLQDSPMAVSMGDTVINRNMPFI